MSGETGLSFPKVVNIVIREGLIRLGKIPESTSQAHLLVDKPFVEEKPIPIEETKTKPKSRSDYSKLNDVELLEAYRKAIQTGDVVAPNLIQYEARNRGYKLKSDLNGNIQFISLKGEASSE